MRAFILEHNGQEVNPTRGGKYSFNAYSLEGGYITVELFPDFEPEIWEESDEREIAQIQEKLGGIPIMCVELELSPDLDPPFYSKMIFDFCTKWPAIFQNLAEEILSCEDVKRTYRGSYLVMGDPSS